MKPSDGEKKLIRETRWSRVYRIAPNGLLYESKMRTDELKVSPDSIRKAWPNLSLEEKLDFAQAFISKIPCTVQDQEIMKFLMGEGPEVVWSTIAFRLPHYGDRESALFFLLERLSGKPEHRANYYQAVELIGDVRALPLLQDQFHDYHEKLAPLEAQGYDDLFDYLQCCQALRKLDGSNKYSAALKHMLIHPNEKVRRRAAQLLDQQESESHDTTQ